MAKLDVVRCPMCRSLAKDQVRLSPIEVGVVRVYDGAVANVTGVSTTAPAIGYLSASQASHAKRKRTYDDDDNHDEDQDAATTVPTTITADDDTRRAQALPPTMTEINAGVVDGRPGIYRSSGSASLAGTMKQRRAIHRRKHRRTYGGFGLEPGSSWVVKGFFDPDFPCCETEWREKNGFEPDEEEII